MRCTFTTKSNGPTYNQCQWQLETPISSSLCSAMNQWARYEIDTTTRSLITADLMDQTSGRPHRNLSQKCRLPQRLIVQPALKCSNARMSRFKHDSDSVKLERKQTEARCAHQSALHWLPQCPTFRHVRASPVRACRASATLHTRPDCRVHIPQSVRCGRDSWPQNECVGLPDATFVTTRMLVIPLKALAS